MGVTVVLLFPIGATFMRLGGSAAGHGAWQILSLCSLIAGFGVGIELAKMRKEVRFISLYFHFHFQPGWKRWKIWNDMY